MNIYTFFSIAIIGMLATYAVAIAYINFLQGKAKGKIADWAVILTAIAFGGPALLITYMSKDVRFEDMAHHRRYLIFGILHTLWQAALIFLLIYFKVFQEA